MKMRDVGWVWEGQGLDPGVYPSIFGVGEGAEFFGLHNAVFLFHETTELAIKKLSPLKHIVVDISKWLLRNCGEGNCGSESYNDSSLETVTAEARKVSEFSIKYTNIAGAMYDDLKGLMQREGQGIEQVITIKSALLKRNPYLYLECVAYAHELDHKDFWKPLASHIDVISFWVWSHEKLGSLHDDLLRCRELFPDTPIRMGCYLRDYGAAMPMPMESLKHQWNVLENALHNNLVNGYEILATVLIDGQQQQAEWIRDFIRANS